VGPAVVREREALSRDGFISVNVLVDRDFYQLRDPQIVTRGFVYKYEADELFQEINETIEDVLRNSKNGKDKQAIESDLEQALKNMLHERSRRRPMLFANVDIV
jgi:ribonuclease J